MSTGRLETSLSYVANADGSGGVLTISDGTHTAHLEFVGNYAAGGLHPWLRWPWRHPARLRLVGVDARPGLGRAATGQFNRSSRAPRTRRGIRPPSAPAVSALRSVGIERRIPFGEVDQPHPAARRRASRTAVKKSCAAIPPGRAPGAPGNWPRSITSMSQSTTIASQCATWASARRHRLGDAVARAPRRSSRPDARRPIASRCIAAELANGASPIWAMFAPGSPSSRSARTGLPLPSPSLGVAQVEMGVERDQPDLVERQAERMHRRPGHRIIAADQQGQRMPRDARRAGVADRRGRLLDAHARRSRHRHDRRSGSPARAASRHRSARSAAASRAAAPGRQVAAPRRDRPRGQRRADQSDRRIGVGVDDQVGKIGPAHALDASSVAAQCHSIACGTACSPTAMSRRWSPQPGNPLGLYPQCRDRHRTTAASSASASAPNSPASAPRKSSRSAAPGSRRGWSTATPTSCSAAPAPTNMPCAAPARPMRKSPRPAAASPRPSPRPRPPAPTSCASHARRRLHALMAGGVTTIEIKSGYGLDTASEIRLLNAARAIGRDEPVRIVTTLLALHALPPGRSDRDAYVKMVAEEMIPAVAARRARDQRRRLLRDHRLHPGRGRARVHRRPRQRPRASASTPSSSATRTAPRSPRATRRCRPTISNISIAAGAKAMAAAGTVAVLLPGAFYALQETKQAAGPAAARRRRADRHRHRLQPGHLALAVADSWR